MDGDGGGNGTNNGGRINGCAGIICGIGNDPPRKCGGNIPGYIPEKDTTFHYIKQDFPCNMR